MYTDVVQILHKLNTYYIPRYPLLKQTTPVTLTQTMILSEKQTDSHTIWLFYWFDYRNGNNTAGHFHLTILSNHQLEKIRR